MSSFPVSVPGRRVSSAYNTVNASSAKMPNFGAWVTLATTIPHGVTGVFLYQMNNLVTTFGVRLGVGAAGSERVVSEPHLWLSAHSNGPTQVGRALIPIRLPAGERLAISTTHVDWIVGNPWRAEFLYGSGLYPIGGRMTRTHGMDLSTLEGAQLTAGASATWGTGVEVVASTPDRALAISFMGRGGHNNTAIRGLVGAFYSGTDILAAASFPVSGGSDSMDNILIPQYAPCSIPKGSAISLRLLNEAAAAPTRRFAISLVY